MAKERRLGRGLEALLGGTPQEPGWEQPAAAKGGGGLPPEFHPEMGGLVWVPIGEIEPNPFQPRREFDEGDLAQLSESMTEHGMLQPMILRKVGNKHQIVAGERRWRAAGLAGWEKVHAQVWDIDDRRMAELAIIENLQRKDLGAIEKGISFKNYLEQYGCTQEELAKRLKINRSTVANLIRLLELPEQVRTAVQEERISPGHARAMITLSDAEKQGQLARRIESEGLSVRAVEDLVKEIQAGGDVSSGLQGKKLAERRERSANLASLEQELQFSLGTKVTLRSSPSGAGKITIHFNSHEEFERLRDYFNDNFGDLQKKKYGVDAIHTGDFATMHERMSIPFEKAQPSGENPEDGDATNAQYG